MFNSILFAIASFVHRNFFLILAVLVLACVGIFFYANYVQHQIGIHGNPFFGLSPLFFLKRSAFQRFKDAEKAEVAQFIQSDAVQSEPELADWFEICEKYPTLKGTGTADNLAQARAKLYQLIAEEIGLRNNDLAPALLAHIFTVNAVNAEHGHPIFPWPENVEQCAKEAASEQRLEYLEAIAQEINDLQDLIPEYWERLAGWDADQDARHLDHETERDDAKDAPEYWTEYAEGHHNEEQEQQRRKKHQEASKQVLELMKANPKKVAYRLATLELDYEIHAQTPVLRDMPYTQVQSLQRRARKFLGMPNNNARYLGMDTDGKHHFAGASEKRQTAATDDARALVATASPKFRATMARCLTWNNKKHQERLTAAYGPENLAKMKQWAQKEKAAR